MPIASHYNIAVAAGLVLQCFPCIAFQGVQLGVLKLGGESLKVGIDDVGRW